MFHDLSDHSAFILYKHDNLAFKAYCNMYWTLDLNALPCPIPGYVALAHTFVDVNYLTVISHIDTGLAYLYDLFVKNKFNYRFFFITRSSINILIVISPRLWRCRRLLSKTWTVFITRRLRTPICAHLLPSTFCIKFQSTAFAGRDLKVAFLVYTHFVFL